MSSLIPQQTHSAMTSKADKYVHFRNELLKLRSTLQLLRQSNEDDLEDEADIWAQGFSKALVRISISQS